MIWANFRVSADIFFVTLLLSKIAFLKSGKNKFYLESLTCRSTKNLPLKPVCFIGSTLCQLTASTTEGCKYDISLSIININRYNSALVIVTYLFREISRSLNSKIAKFLASCIEPLARTLVLLLCVEYRHCMRCKAIVCISFLYRVFLALGTR